MAAHRCAAEDCEVPVEILDAMSQARMRIGGYLKVLALEEARKHLRGPSLETVDLLAAICDLSLLSVSDILETGNDRKTDDILRDVVINDSDINLICVYKAYVTEHALADLCENLETKKTHVGSARELVVAYTDSLQDQIKKFDIAKLDGLLAGVG